MRTLLVPLVALGVVLVAVLVFRGRGARGDGPIGVEVVASPEGRDLVAAPEATPEAEVAEAPARTPALPADASIPDATATLRVTLLDPDSRRPFVLPDAKMVVQRLVVPDAPPEFLEDLERRGQQGRREFETLVTNAGLALEPSPEELRRLPPEGTLELAHGYHFVGFDGVGAAALERAGGGRVSAKPGRVVHVPTFDEVVLYATPMSWLEGRVVGGDGAPLGRAFVEARRYSSPSPHGATSFSTDADGAYRVRVPSGSFLVWANRGRFAATGEAERVAAIAKAELPPFETVRLDLTLRPPAETRVDASVSITVLDTTRPLELLLERDRLGRDPYGGWDDLGDWGEQGTWRPFVLPSLEVGGLWPGVYVVSARPVDEDHSRKWRFTKLGRFALGESERLEVTWSWREAGEGDGR